MTTDKKVKGNFKSERQRSMCMAHIRELKFKEVPKSEIYDIILKEFDFNRIPHKRTVYQWVAEVRYSKKTQAEEEVMAKWREEYEESPSLLNKDEVQLEEMFDLAHSRGIPI